MNPDKSWTLFADRDGVVNLRMEGDYVRSWDQFRFLRGVRDAFAILSRHFGTICIVTNQQGIGKSLYTESDLASIHAEMITEIQQWGGRIDGVFYCPHLKDDPACDCRKPKTGMALQAKEKFPSIDFTKSVMVGDARSDMLFAQELGMHKVWIGNEPDPLADSSFPDLLAFARSIESENR